MIGKKKCVNIVVIYNYYYSFFWLNQYEEKLKEAKNYAINRNQLAEKTVYVLKVITSDTTRPFVIPIIVDRMAAMLNYVLKQLVGEKSKNLKVRFTQFNGM